MTIQILSLEEMPKQVQTELFEQAKSMLANRFPSHDFIYDEFESSWCGTTSCYGETEFIDDHGLEAYQEISGYVNWTDYGRHLAEERGQTIVIEHEHGDFVLCVY